MGWGNPVVGGTVLRIPAIQSPDFLSGLLGWIIRLDGSAEFNDLDIRGTFHGNDFILNADGAFFYNGTPGPGNLIVAITSAAGTDPVSGQAYPRGISLWQADPGAGNRANFLTGDPSEGTPARIFTNTFNNGSGVTNMQIVIESAKGTFLADSTAILLAPTNSDGSAAALGLLLYVDSAGAATTMASWDYAGFSALGSINAVDPASPPAPDKPATFETWHYPALDSGWTNLASNPIRYRKLPDGNVQWSGAATHAGFTTTQVIISALDPNYVPAKSQELPPGLGTSNATGIAVSSSGVVQCRVNETGTVTTTCAPQGSYPLD